MIVGSHYALLTDSIPLSGKKREWEETFMTYNAPANLTAAGMILVS
jgi:hypothetical protein